MMFPELRFAHNSQRGFSLVELLIAIAIAGLITGGIAAAIHQMLTISSRSSNRMVAVRQVQQAGKEVSQDILQAQNVTYGGCTDCLLSLSWTEIGGSNATRQIRYTLVDKRLKREDLSLNSTTIVAECITSASIIPAQSCSFPNCPAYRFTVTANVSGQSETQVYEARPRPGS